MTTTDAAFLVEVENFLTSNDIPLIPVTDKEDSDEQRSYTRESVVDDLSRRNLTRKEWIQLDAATKLELERVKDRNRRRTYRQQRRSERDSLKQQVDKLTNELQQARQEQTSISAWELVAQRQCAVRRSAELHQKRLCEAINTNSSLIQEFRRLVTERLDDLGDIHHLEEDQGIALNRPKRIRLESADTELFAAYIRELDAVYARTDDMLRASRLDSTDANWDDPTEEWDEDADTGFFKFRGKVTLPFDAREICQSQWHVAHLYHRQESRELYEEVEDPDNTLAFKFRLTSRLNSGSIASVSQRAVIRRYQDDTRTVLVWRRFTEGEGTFTGMHADETGWGVVTPAISSSKTGSVLRTCVHNVPMHFSSAATENPACVKQFAGKLFEWGQENHLESTFGLEKLLIK